MTETQTCILAWAAVEFDRSTEGVAAIVTHPVMVDTAAGAEAGLFSDQQGAAATRTFRPTGM